MKMTGLRGYWAILFGCLVLCIAIASLASRRAAPVHAVYTQLNPDMRIMMSWMNVSPDELKPGSYEFKMLLDSLQAAAGTARPPICTIEDEVASANGASGRRLYRISMTRDQFATFRQAAISHGAEEIDPPKNPDDVPAWWNPPKVKSLRWIPGFVTATYDSNRQLLFFRNYKLDSET